MEFVSRIQQDWRNVSGFAFEDLFHRSLEFFVLDHTIAIDIQNFEEVSSALESIFHKSVPQHTIAHMHWLTKVSLKKSDLNKASETQLSDGM